MRVKVGGFGIVQRLGCDAAWRRIVLALTLLAFAAQSFVTQAHIHLPPAFETPGAIPADNSKNGSFASSPRTNNAGDDAATCPFCQEIVAAGQYLSPSAIGILPPTIANAIIPIALYARTLSRICSHAWQGRAPPSL